MMYLSCYLTE